MYPVYSVGKITLSEVPGKTSLVLEFGKCQQHCRFCHSPWLWDDEDGSVMFSLVELVECVSHTMNDDINCILLMGGTNNGFPLEDLKLLVETLYSKFACPVALYSGSPEKLLPMSEMAYWHGLDYLKTGDYRYDLGGLENPKTNQKFYQKEFNHFIRGSSVSLAPYWQDITFKFRSKK